MYYFPGSPAKHKAGLEDEQSDQCHRHPQFRVSAGLCSETCFSHQIYVLTRAEIVYLETAVIYSCFFEVECTPNKDINCSIKSLFQVKLSFLWGNITLRNEPPDTLFFAEETLGVCGVVSYSPGKRYSKCIFLVSQYMKNILESLVPESLMALTRISEVLPLLGLFTFKLLLFHFQCLLAGMCNGSKILSCLIHLFCIKAVYYLYQISLMYGSLSKYEFFFLHQITEPEQ